MYDRPLLHTKMTNFSNVFAKLTKEDLVADDARLYGVEKVMERLGVGRSTAFALIASGELRSVKIGRRRLVSEAALVDFIAKVDHV